MIESKLVLYGIEFNSILMEHVYKMDTIDKPNSSERYLEMTKSGILPFSHMTVFLSKFSILKKMDDHFLGDNDCLQIDKSFFNNETRLLELKKIPIFSKTIDLDFSEAYYKEVQEICLNKYMNIWIMNNGFCIFIKNPTSQYYNKIYEHICKEDEIDKVVLDISDGSINLENLRKIQRVKCEKN